MSKGICCPSSYVNKTEFDHPARGCQTKDEFRLGGGVPKMTDDDEGVDV